MKFLSKSQQVFFFLLVDVEKLNLELICKGIGARIAKIILKWENKVINISLPDEKSYCIATVIRLYHRHMDQWIRMENSETDFNKYAQLIFDRQRCKAIR